MRCPKCNREDTKVKDTRNLATGIRRRRRRECPDCGHRFTTTEIIGKIRSEDIAPLFSTEITKRDGNVEQFDPKRFAASLERACRRLEISKADIDELAQQLINKIAEASMYSPAKVAQVVEWAVAGLAEHSNMAAMRYALAYMEFAGPEEFHTFSKKRLAPKK